MNLGQYVSDLIRTANRIQKITADTNDPDKIYHLALEAKDASSQIQFWAVCEMAGKNNEKP